MGGVSHGSLSHERTARDRSHFIFIAKFSVDEREMSSFMGSISKKPRRSQRSTVVGKSQAQVERRNARERKRVEQVNQGYENLAVHVSFIFLVIFADF